MKKYERAELKNNSVKCNFPKATLPQKQKSQKGLKVSLLGFNFVLNM